MRVVGSPGLSRQAPPPALRPSRKLRVSPGPRLAGAVRVSWPGPASLLPPALPALEKLVRRRCLEHAPSDQDRPWAHDSGSCIIPLGHVLAAIPDLSPCKSLAHPARLYARASDPLQGAQSHLLSASELPHAMTVPTSPPIATNNYTNIRTCTPNARPQHDSSAPHGPPAFSPAAICNGVQANRGARSQRTRVPRTSRHNHNCPGARIVASSPH